MKKKKKKNMRSWNLYDLENYKNFEQAQPYEENKEKKTCHENIYELRELQQLRAEFNYAWIYRFLFGCVLYPG